MYINKIDDLIDNVIDEFYGQIIVENKALVKILKEPNFVKHQKEINEIMKEFINSINMSEISELVKSSDAINTISQAIKRYIAFYLFLTIGASYSAKEDTYINNVIEFSKNQPEYGFKIDNFFNSESNAILIKYNIMIRNILFLMEADSVKIEAVKSKPDIKQAAMFLNELGKDYINKNFIVVQNNRKKRIFQIVRND